MLVRCDTRYGHEIWLIKRCFTSFKSMPHSKGNIAFDKVEIWSEIWTKMTLSFPQASVSDQRGHCVSFMPNFMANNMYFVFFLVLDTEINISLRASY